MPTAFDIAVLIEAIGEVLFDPGLWPAVMQSICESICAEGAALLQGDVRTADIPRTAGLDSYIRNYFAHDFHIADIRAVRGVPLLISGARVVTDSEIFRSESEMMRDPLYRNLGSFGLKWFSVIGFRSQEQLWGLSIQRTPRQGMFDEEEKFALSQLTSSLTQVATLSRLTDHAVLSGAVDAMENVRCPALAIGRNGIILAANASAQAYLDREILIRGGRIALQDAVANAQLHAMFKRMSDRALDDQPVVVMRRADKRPLLIKFVHVPSPARSPFLGAWALLLLKDLDEGGPMAPLDHVADVFALTPAQARVAAHLIQGRSLEQVAQELGIGFETARSHLKALFAKTQTRRQSELIAVLLKVAQP